MQFKLQLVSITDDGKEKIKDIVSIKKNSKSIEQLGLSIKDSKAILNKLQKTIIDNQIDENIEQNNCCKHCGQKLKIKDNNIITYRTLFGKIDVKSPRYKKCDCSSSEKKSFSPITELLSERTSPELSYVQNKFASLIWRV